jgi:predicted 2-oxoglutarate/Fe(II)-dependent dioxygenase YbiX
MPAIVVEGIGRLAFPVLPAQVDLLVGAAEAAPYGRGAATLVDRDVRRTWQLDPGRIRISGKRWAETLAGLAAEAAQSLGIAEPVAAEFYKLLVYDTGSFFVDHRDTEKSPGMFATLSITLPSACRGGELVVRHLGREVVLDPHPTEPSEIGVTAFYADCVHEVRPVTEGSRVALIYNLLFLGRKAPPGAPDHRGARQRITTILGGWAAGADEPDKLVLPLEHAYTQAELSFETLKGRDGAVAAVLAEAAAAADCDLHLVLLSIEESGTAEYNGDYRRKRWSRDDDEDEDDFEIGEVCDSSLTLSHWRRPDGGTVGYGAFPFTEEELCPPDAFEDLEPDEQHFQEATGNSGASFERSYRRAALVLWPVSRRLAVLNQAGLEATLPHLADLAARWERSGEGIDSPVWREADELSGHMLRTWPRESWRRDAESAPGKMLDLLVRFGNRARIDAFLAEIPAEGCYAAADNPGIVASAALLPAARATELLLRIIRRNMARMPGACAALLRQAVEAPAGPVSDPATLGAALLDLVPGDPARNVPADTWPRETPSSPDFVLDLLTGSSRIDAALAARAVEHLLAWPETYEFDAVLVPAALAFAGQPEAAAWPAVGRLRAACLDHLRRRIAQELAPPGDWVRPNLLNCSCADCRALAVFLVDPDQRVWQFRAAQDRRSHVAQSVARAGCDLDLATEKRGSPHVLVATKNQASYERRAAQRRQDLAHLAALDG